MQPRYLCLGLELPPFHYMVATFGSGPVKCARYRISGLKLSLSVIDAIKDSKVCLLANHGVIVGESISEAYENAVLLEELKMYLISISVGKPNLLPEDEMVKLKNKFKPTGKKMIVNSNSFNDNQDQEFGNRPMKTVSLFMI